MRAEILSVDYAPDDLYGQLPVRATLTRMLPGPNRPDYWLAHLDKPVAYTRESGETSIEWIVLASRYVGESIHPGVGRIVIGLSYVLDVQQVELPTVDMSKCKYVAIGEARIQ